jgi:hypothetical protein
MEETLIARSIESDYMQGPNPDGPSFSNNNNSPQIIQPIPLAGVH